MPDADLDASLDLQDLRNRVARINDRVKPCAYSVNEIAPGPHDEAPALFIIYRSRDKVYAPTKVVTMTFEPARAYLNGIEEGAKAALLRW